MGHPSLVRDPETVMRVFRLQVVVSPTKRVRDMRGMRGKADEKGA